MFQLLTRDAFRHAVFTRDQHYCVNCGDTAQDAHHILERRLFPDGGYYLANGASVCGPCHLLAESTELDCDTLRSRCKISKFPLPPHLYRDQEYDKWGNPLLPNGMRLKGELFHDPSVQKILAPVLHLFTNQVKYPRTWHLPWSPGVGKDDRVISDLSTLQGAEIVVTVKMDGENTSIYRDGLHARSLDYSPHPSRNHAKVLQNRIGYELPEGWRLCGENLYAKHSIAYHGLDDYFLAFSLWNEVNTCLGWDETVEWCELLEVPMVPVLYRGSWDEELLRSLHQNEYQGDECEGYVVRVTDEFTYGEFSKKAAKYVRANHVQTHGNWLRQKIIVNEKKA